MAEKYWWEQEEQQNESQGYWWENDSIAATASSNIVNRVNTWLSNHKNYVSNYQSRNAGRKYNYEDSYVSDSGKWLETVNQQKSNFDAEADSILSYMDQFKGYLDEDWMKSVRDTLTGARGQQSSIVESATKDNEWWSNFADETEYKTAQRYDGYNQKYTAKKYEDIQKALSTLEDGSEEKWWLGEMQYDLYKNDSTYQNRAMSGLKSFEAQKVADQATESDKTWWDKVSDFVIDTYSEPITDNPMLDSIMDQRELYVDDTTWKEPTDDWSEGQKRHFGYLWSEDPSKAYKYAEQVNNQINAKKKYEQQQAIGAAASKNFGTGTLGTLGAIASAPMGLGDFMDDLIEYSARGTITQKSMLSPFEMGQAAQSGIANKLNEYGTIGENVWILGGKGLGDVYSLGVSAANSLVSAYTLGGAGTLVNFIGQGGAAGVDDALSRGATPEQALLYGSIVGAAEGVTEMINADNLLKIGSSSTLKNYLLKALNQGIGESVEEGASSLIGNIADNIIMQDKSNFYTTVQQLMDDNPGMSEEEAKKKAWVDMVGGVVFDAMGGFVTGSTNAMTVGAASTAWDARSGSQKNIDAVKQYGGKTDALIQEGLQNDVKSDSYKLAQKYQQQVQGKDGKGGKAMTGYQIRNLLAANQEQITANDMQKIQKAAENRLVQKGQKEDVTKLADLATKYVTGQELSRSEKSFLARNKIGAQVTSEMLNAMRGVGSDKLLSKWENDMSEGWDDSYSTEWAENIETKGVYGEAQAKRRVRALLDAVVEDPAAYKSLEERVGTEGRFGVSESGQATIRATGKAFDFDNAEVAEVGDGQMSFKREDGGKVSAGGIDFVDANQSFLVSAVSNIENITPAAATSIMHEVVDMSKPMGQQLNGIDEAFTYGYHGYSEADLKAGNFVGNLTSEQMMRAYELGKAARTESIDVDETKRVNMRTAAEAKMTAEQKTAKQKARFESDDLEVYFLSKKDGSISKFDGNTDGYTERKADTIRATQFLSKMKLGGSGYYLYESYVNDDGKRVYKDENGVEKIAPNGIYRAKDGRIYIDLNAGEYGQGLGIYALGHELGHFVKHQSKKQFKILGDLITEAYAKTGLPMHDRVLEKQKLLSDISGEAVSYTDAYEEVVCDALSTMIADGSFYEKVTEIKVKDKGLFATIKRFFEKMFAKFKESYAELTPDQKDAQDIREMKDMFDRIQTAFAEALVEASDNFHVAMESVVEENAKPVEADEILTEGAVVTDGNGERFSIRSMKHDISEGKMFEDLKTVCGWTDAQVMTLRQQLNALVEYMIPYRNILDMNETYGMEGRRFSPYKPNSDPLYKISMDFSTLCSKRLLTQYVIENLQLRENRPMSAEEQMAIRDMLNEYRKVEKGLQVACAMCYVEAARLKSPKQMQRWLDDPAPLLKDYFGKKNKDFNDSVKNAQADFKESKGYDREAPKKDMKPADVKELNKIGPKMRSQYQLSAEEQAIVDRAKTLPNSTYLTAGNLANLSETDPVIYDAYTAFVRTATRSKSLETDEPYYYGDSMRDNGNGIVVTDSFIEAVNRENGMRFSSWSDWRIQHLLDYITAVIDNSVRGAAMHGYTKFGDEVRVLGKTGMMFNMSGVAGTQTGLNPDGSLSFSDTESIDVNEAIQLRKEFPDTAGLQCIGVGDDHITALLRSDIIDYVIPYHVSGLNAALRRMADIHGWKDYTGTQHAAIDKGIKFEDAVDKEHWHEEPVYSEFFVGYDTGMTGIEAMRASAEKYKQLCKDRGLTPKFNQFAKEENYWKLLIDRKMINQKNGKLIQQKAVTPTFDFDSIKQVVDRHVQNYDAGLESRALNHIVENWDSIPNRIKDLKKGNKAKKSVDTLANQTVAAQPKEAGEKYSYRGKNKDGIEVYETSDEIKNLSYKERQKLFLDIMTNEYRGRTAKFVHNGQAYYATFDEKDVNKNIYGDKLSDKKGWKAKINAGADGDIFELVENAKYDGSKQEKGKKITAHRGVGSWDYFIKSVQIDGTVFDLLANVRRKADGDYVYSIQLTENKKIKASPPLGSLLRASSGVTNAFTNNVTQPTLKVNKNSERTGDSVSNRHLLANAFEGIVQNSKEYEMIQQYRDHIAELNKLEAKLSDLNADIRKMLFDKNVERDAKKLKELQDEAKEVAGEINKHDKKLLQMEASEPLRKVIERERKKEAQKTKDHVKQLIQNKKDRAEQTELRHKIRKTVRDLDKILNRGNKKQNVKEDMKDLVSKALELADYLFTDHISNDELIRRGITVSMRGNEPQLVKETEEILSQLYDHADSLTDEEFARLDAKRKANEEKLRELLKAQRNERLNTPVAKLFDDLVKAYASLKNSSQDAVKAAYNEELEKSLRAFMSDDSRVKILENMRVADMTAEELNWLYRAYTMVLTNVRDANKFHVKGMTETIDQKVGRIVSDFSSRKIPDGQVAIVARNLANKIGWDYEKLHYALDRIGSEAFTELIMNLANSENIVMEDIIEAAAFRDQIVKQYGFNNWAVNKEIDREFLDNTGKKFKLTLGQLMSLYAYSRREGAWDHIEYGGFVFGEAALTNPRPADSYKLSKEQCEAITSTLTKEQRAYVEDMQKFLSETMGAKGNEVSMQLYGIKMFGEKNYFPIHVAGQFKAQAQESQAKAAAGFGSMSNAGFTHAQNPNAKAPFVLEGFNEVWTDHVNEMSRYHGTVPALEDIRRVMNRSSYSDAYLNSMSVKAVMENAFGKDAVDYFDNLYREANSGAITDKLQKKSKKLLSLFRKNSVAYSLSVLVQQPASMVRAYALIDRKYFGFKGVGAITSGVAKAVTSKWNPAYANAYNEMLKYAPGVTMTKEIGGFDTATGGSIRSYLLDTNKSTKQKWKTGTALEKGAAVMDLVDNNAIANLPNVADKIAWIEIWNACKRETVATRKDLVPNSEEFMQAVGERFTEVTRATQVYDSIFAKSPMLKSKNLAVQYLVSFMNEPNTVANMVEKAVRDVTKGDWKQGARTAVAVIHSIIFTNVLKSMIYALRDDDEDETYTEKYIEAVVGNMMSDFNPLNYIPIARDAWSIAQGYDVERADMAIVADALDALGRVLKNAFADTADMTEEELAEFDKKVSDANWKLVESLAAFFGIPVKNVRREIEAVINHARIASSNAGLTTKLSLEDTIYEAVIESIPFMSGKKSKADKLYDAIIEGDKTYIGRIKSTYKDDDAYHAAVRNALTANDKRIKEAALAHINGDPSERVRIAKQIIADGFDLNDVVMAINAEIAKMTPDDSTDTKKVKGMYKVEDFVREAANGDTASLGTIREDILQTAQANGKTEAEAEKDFVSDIKSETKKAYIAGALDEVGAAEILTVYADMDDEEADGKINYWAFQKVNPEYEDLTQTQVEKYYEFAEPAEIPLEIFQQYVDGTKGLETIKDEWGDEVQSKRDQVLAVIDSLPLTWRQKDALYLAHGYAESKIWDVPW